MNIRRAYKALYTVGAVLALASLVTGVYFRIADVKTHDYNLSADVRSIDNFYDEDAGRYSGEVKSDTRFFYQSAQQKSETVACVVNTFRVAKPDGSLIFQAVREREVDVNTSKLVGVEGYLFAPAGLRIGEGFTYWHVNYETPLQMQFVSRDDVAGTKTYMYYTRTIAGQVNQTNELTGVIPDVGDTRGVELDVELWLWIHPQTGRLVKYRDATVAWYYDLQTGQRLNPWNKFSNEITETSSSYLASQAQDAGRVLLMDQWAIPTLLMLMALMSFLFGRILHKDMVIEV